MLTRLRPHLTYANVMATIAVFLALGGGVAWALSNNSVKSKHIVNEAIKAVDIADGELADLDSEDAVNASALGGHEDEVYMRSPALETDPVNAGEARYNSYYLDTTATGSSIAFGTGDLVIENVGTVDKFRVCNAATGGPAIEVTVYAGVTRTQSSIASSTCTAEFTIPDDGDFTVSGERAKIFGFAGQSEDDYFMLGFDV